MADGKERKKSRVVDIVRWVLVLPAAIGGTVLGCFILHWVILCTFQGETIQLSPGAADALERIISPAFSSAFFVSVGAMVAPRGRLAVSIVLALTLHFLLVGGLIWGISEHVVYVSNPLRSLFMTALSFLGAGIGIVLIFFEARKEVQEGVGNPDF